MIQRRLIQRLGVGILGLFTALLLSLPTGLTVQSEARSAPATVAPTNITAIVDLLKQAGLTVDHLHTQPTAGQSPSAPPSTEHAAWSFTLHGIAHGDIRVLIFSNQHDRDIKAAWFHQVHGRVMIEHDAIIWFNPRMPQSTVTQCEHALAGLR